MLEKYKVEELEPILGTLIKGGSDFTLLGGKSSGKTTLIKSIMENLFKDYYIYLNSTIVDSRDSFLFLFTFELSEFLKVLNQHFVTNKFPDKYSEPNSIITLNQWVKDINKTIKDNKKQFDKIKRIHVVIDNIEQLRLSENFMNQFYQACKNQITGVKFSLVFVGSNLYSRSFDLDKPFSKLPVFYMPKPDIKKVIARQISNFDFGVQESPSLKKLKNYLETLIFNAFETIEDEYEKMRQITKIILDETKKCHDKDLNFITGWMKENSKTILDRIKKYGPVQIQNIEEEEIDRERGRETLSKFQEELKYENYPNLIMTSIFLANGHPETDDYKRFKDYRIKKKSKRDKKIGRPNNRKGEKNMRHNIQRIVAISQILEHISQDAGKNDRVPYLMQKQLQHHSLDYYGCFEYLREENEISYYGKINRAYGGKIIGNMKQDHAKQFFRRMSPNISINQFIDL